jgi:hypothetical protein
MPGDHTLPPMTINLNFAAELLRPGGSDCGLQLTIGLRQVIGRRLGDLFSKRNAPRFEQFLKAHQRRAGEQIFHNCLMTGTRDTVRTGHPDTRIRP